MRTWLFILAAALSVPTLVFAKEEGLAGAAQKEDVRVLGRLNVNTATREELLALPMLDAQKVDQLMDARARGPLTSLAVFQLPPEASLRMTLSGPSTLRRIRPLPLEIFTPASSSAAR